MQGGLLLAAGATLFAGGSTTATPTARPASTPQPVRALDVLAFIAVENEHDGDYDRAAFAEGLDLDDNGCRARDDVLRRDSISPPTLEGCSIVGLEWFSPYDGVTVTDPALIEVDHVVALSEAWDSGAWQWDPDHRAAFANDLDDPRTLRAVTASSNEAKGDADPSNWIPNNDDAVCQYLADWIAIKARWALSADQSEHGRIGNLLDERCPDQLLDPWPDAPPPDPDWIPPTTIPANTVPAIQPAADIDDGNCSPAYPTTCIPPAPPDLDCGDVAARRFEVLPPDPHNFDGDGDGIGCES